MATFDATITNFIAGDDLTIERSVTNVTSGAVIASAWFTVKRSYSDLDSVAIIQKIVTAVLSSDGQIDDTGVDGTGHVKFLLTSTDTEKLTPLSDYKYDIQIRLNSGVINTPELGVITAFPQVTRST